MSVACEKEDGVGVAITPRQESDPHPAEVPRSTHDSGPHLGAGHHNEESSGDGGSEEESQSLSLEMFLWRRVSVIPYSSLFRMLCPPLR